MEASFIAAVFLHPVALLILGFAVFAAVYLGAVSDSSEIRLSRARLLCGFIGVLLAALTFAAVTSYVPPSEAARFGVAPENYWAALRNQFLVLAVLIVYVALIGCAAIGVPIVVQLAKRNLATVPLVVGVSIPISLAVLVPLMLASSSDHGRLVRDLAWATGAHAVFALSFAVGARLPWRKVRAK
jgi:hypothetical protein